MFQIIAVSLIFWGGIFFIFRSMVRMRTIGHEREISRLKMQQVGEADNIQPSQPKGPSMAAKAVRGFGNAVAWTAPRLLAGTVVAGKKSFSAAKFAATKTQAWNQARVMAKADAAKAAEPIVTPAGGNVLTPEQETEMQTPAYMRKGKSIDAGHTLH